jgi:transposase
MKELRLGIDVACRADHQASLADESGELLWSGHRFRTRPRELDVLWAKIPAGVPLIVVMEPTRNAWVALAAWLQARGAKVVLVPAEQLEAARFGDIALTREFSRRSE